MTLLWIIYITCVIAWLLPPFRQYKTKYFPYFLCLALADPATLFMCYILGFKLWQGHVTTSLVNIFLLINMKGFKKYSVAPLVMILVMFMIPVPNDNTLRNIVAANLFITAAIIARDFTEDIKLSEGINSFYIVLLLYNISGIMKILFSVSHVKTGYIYFFVTNFFQLFIAGYFTMFSVKNAKKIVLAKVIPERGS